MSHSLPSSFNGYSFAVTLHNGRGDRSEALYRKDQHFDSTPTSRNASYGIIGTATYHSTSTGHFFIGAGYSDTDWQLGTDTGIVTENILKAGYQTRSILFDRKTLIGLDLRFASERWDIKTGPRREGLRSIQCPILS